MIKHLKHGDIDKRKWDICIEQSVNTLVYGHSWFLDIVAPGWEAIVLGDYEAVFPLTGAKKFLFSYLYQPFFTQQLGIFYKTSVGRDAIPDMLKSIPPGYKYIDINLNEGNGIESTQLKLRKRKNLVLDLDKPYVKLLKNYDDNAKRNVKKARKITQTVETIPADSAIDFYVKHKADQTEGLRSIHYEILKRLAETLNGKKLLLSYGVKSPEQKLLAAGIFVLTKGRIIYLLGTASPEGKEMRAMYMLFDHIISLFSEHPILLDFEGSERTGIARFFKGFGAEKRPYFKYKVNNLPWPLSWIKS